ncbi:hypothetical protein [Jeotgalibaca ciconiae]|uniref:Exo-alpha-sialidase n=1 Tax=Jeotgalibaca ciconiae TaxID=2496265 RepID=A0A3S9H8G6_9LACT|nr:hypothetical protein [Jeotgalibaca ciconiae]AZP03571.1 hypothetical protein EJN90_02175 [Jeotgalibaca ciconiae]
MTDLFYEKTILKPLFNTGYLDAGTTYPRLIKLNEENKKGVFLATCDQGQLIKGRQVWPIFRTEDYGKTWDKIIDFQNDYEDCPLQMNPVLFEIPKGTNGFESGMILLSGIIKPQDISKTILPIYYSKDGGYHWNRLAQVDGGGPAIYNNSPEAKTTAIWEPLFFVNKYGDLTIGYSDERMKSEGILQALVLKYFNPNKNTWSPIYPMVAYPHPYHRPGMISIVRTKNSGYVGVYEVVNSPSIEKNFAEIFVCHSEDGLVWNFQDMGTKIKTRDGVVPGSAPFVSTINTEKGEAIIVSSKWMIVENEVRNCQDLFINYTDGYGYWDRIPMPISYNCVNTEVENSAYSQSILGGDNELFQLVTVNNEKTQLNDLMFGSLKLPDFTIDAKQMGEENNILTFLTKDATSSRVAELTVISRLRIKVPSTNFINSIAIRYRSVSYPSTLLLWINNQPRLIYLEKTHKKFKWIFVKVNEIIYSEIFIEDLQGARTIEIDSCNFYFKN